jgi:hypothetical protein
VVIGLQILTVASWRYWWGGHCWGSRLLAETVPLFGLLCVRPVGLLCRLRGSRPFLAGLAAVAFPLHAAGVYPESYWVIPGGLDQHPEMLWSWSRPPFLALWQQP